MIKVDILDWIWKTFGVGGIMSVLLGLAVYALWKYVKNIHHRISELHEKYNSKIEKMITDHQARIDSLNVSHENRIDEMSKAFRQSIEKVSATAHDDHVRMEFLIQGLHN